MVGNALMSLAVAAVSVASAEAQVLAMPASVAPSDPLFGSDQAPETIDFDIPMRDEPWMGQAGMYSWQLLPDGLMFRSYLAGQREPRFASQWVREQDQGWLWDVALGGRVGILRYGTDDPLMPQGWQIDI